MHICPMCHRTNRKSVVPTAYWSVYIHGKVLSLSLSPDGGCVVDVDRGGGDVGGGGGDVGVCEGACGGAGVRARAHAYMCV